MQLTVLITAALVAVAAASPINDKRVDDDCKECAAYCNDPANGSAVGFACYVVKCGITVS